SPSRAQPPADASRSKLDTSAAQPISRWFRFVEHDQFDSLPQLLTTDFRFESDGRTWDRLAFVAMIRGLGIHHPVIELTDVRTERLGGAAVVSYKRRETFELNGIRRSVDELGTLQMVQLKGRWLIKRWKA